VQCWHEKRANGFLALTRFNQVASLVIPSEGKKTQNHLFEFLAKMAND
jgi:hypothetical protein